MNSYTVKKVTDFSVPSRDVTNQTLPGKERVNYSPPGRVWFVAGDEKMAYLFFYSVSAVE